MITIKNGEIHITGLGHREAANLACRYILTNLGVSEQELVENTIVSSHSVVYDDGIKRMAVNIS